MHAGGEDPSEGSCQHADSTPGSLRNVAAAPARAARAAARFLLPDNSQARARPHPSGRFSTPLSPRHAMMVGRMQAWMFPLHLPPPLLSPQPVLSASDALVSINRVATPDVSKESPVGKEAAPGAGGGAVTSPSQRPRAPALPGLLPAHDLGLTGLPNVNLSYRSPYTGSVHLSI